MKTAFKIIKKDIRETPARTHITSICMSLGLVLIGVGVGLKWGGVVASRHLLMSDELLNPMQSIAPALNSRIQLVVYTGMVALVVAVYLQTNE